MRKLAIIDCRDVLHTPQFLSDLGVCNTPLQPAIQIPPKFESIPFSNTKSLLGNEYPYAIYDMRAEQGVNFNLEAFAILAGTIQKSGTLYLLCSNWDNVENETDFDSLRWNDNQAIQTPNFWAFFKTLVTKYHFNHIDDCRGESHSPPKIVSKFKGECDLPLQLNAKQQFILQNLPNNSADIHLITAPRGRGKSTLAGLLAEKLAKQHSVLVTSRSRANLPRFFASKTNIPFFAPDHLIEQIKSQLISPYQWLFIDEAASLPLPMLNQFCDYFDKVVLTTTTHNYEGTGLGFELKLPKMLNKPFKHWTLSKPLRWKENDPLERFITDLLLLSEENAPLFSKEGQGEIWQKQLSKNIIYSNKHLQEKISFYQLLSLAHYKTTPTDLRRLFDGENQQLFEIRENQCLIAGAWGIFEGGLDSDLSQRIWQGNRRPQGNLVAQYLCFQGNLPQACQLRSLRISRIAVVPEMQNQGIGKRLISDLILQKSAEKQPLDFLSVSFGLTTPLYAFWRSCGFQLVQITPNKEASSGYRSAMMIYPISEQGQIFCKQAKQAFTRDFALQPFFADICEELQDFDEFQPLADLNLTESDWLNLQGFIVHSRTLSAIYISLKRLYYSDKQTFAFLQDIFEQENLESLRKPKFWLENCRKMLQERLDLKKH